MNVSDIWAHAVGSGWVVCLTILWFLTCCIDTWQKRVVQRHLAGPDGKYKLGQYRAIKDANSTNVFEFRGQIISMREGRVNLVSWVHVGLLVAIAVLDWRWAILIYLAVFIFEVVLGGCEKIGSLLAKPFYTVSG